MSKSAYIYSTLTDSNLHTGYDLANGNDLKPIERQVLVKGGAGLANENFVTPDGVLTIVTNEELEWLLRQPLFALHVANGYVKHSFAQADANKIAAEMNRRDGAAPLTQADIPSGEPVPNEGKVDDAEIDRARAAPTVANAKTRGKARR